MDSLQIIRSAPSMQIQDLGRYGVSHHGLSPGGALDLHAHCWANHLLGNSLQSPTLEILIGNTELVALRDSNISLTGADMNASVDGLDIANWSSFTLLKGQKLKLSYASSGLRAYLGISGGYLAASTLGSVSTVLRNNIGNNLRNEDILQSPLTDLPSHHRRTPSNFIPHYEQEITLRLIANEPDCLIDHAFTVSPDSDRTGVRLHTDSPLSTGAGIISEPSSLGAIQLPADGQPIILLNDRQTQGGYRKLGHVAKIDLPKIAQARPGTKIRFQKTSLTEAREAWMIFMKYFSTKKLD